MPTKFSDFFKLEKTPDDDFQVRIYNVLSDATTIVECYLRIYEYIIAGLKWHSRKARHDYMDDTVDLTDFDKMQMKDSELYFEEGALGEWNNMVLFEYLVMEKQEAAEYGPNVFIPQLNPEEKERVKAKTACRQLELYFQVGKYNQEYETQDEYCKKNGITSPLPNSVIKVDPKVEKERINPDSEEQKAQLIKFVDELVTWVKDNYPDVKALMAVTDVKGLFDLISTPKKLPDEVAIDSLQTMLNSIRSPKDTYPSVKKEFGQKLIKQLEEKSKFWGNNQISDAYASIKALEGAFLSKTKRNLKMYEFFVNLFIDFLSLDQYKGESEADAQKRRTDALTYIVPIFCEFNPDNPQVNTAYETRMETALGKIKENYPIRYINNLLEAKKPISKNEDVKIGLPTDFVDALKEKADNLIGTLPLLRGETKVRLFTLRDVKELQALNPESVGVDPQDNSLVYVKADPSENGSEKYRPLYRKFKYDLTTINVAIAFCNLSNQEPGTFYYQRLEEPSTVEVAATNEKDRTLTIDFLNYTIMYPDKKNGKNKNDNGQLYRSGGKTACFFDDLKATTKWTKIEAKRRYDPYYSTVASDVLSSEQHLMAYIANGHGLARALPLGDNSLCLWVWNESNTLSRVSYERLGEFLGLPTDRQIIPLGNGGLEQLETLNQSCKVQIGSTLCDFYKYDTRQFKPNGFHYSIISITNPAETNPEEKVQFFVRANTPSPSAAEVLMANNDKRRSRQLADDPKAILNLFNFSYYRRITSTPDDKTKEPFFSADSKVIQLFSPNNKQIPSNPETKVTDWDNGQFKAVEVNLPICFNLKENVIQYFRDKQNRGKIINKGNSLYRAQKPRKDAGVAMSPIYKKLKSSLSTALSSSKVPATAFANGVLRQSEAAQEDWNRLKVSSYGFLPTNQEWCHLRGHGDGGEESPGNFVSGSFHCNTEQLAIETGQRLVTQQMPERTFLLHTTAYLLRDATNYESKVDIERKSQVLNGNYLTDEVAYTEMLRKNIARRSRELDADDNPPLKEKRTNDMLVESPTPEQGSVAPVAAFLRYKVMRCGITGSGSSGGERQSPDKKTLGKVFDFLLEGQGEFIDKNQYTMIVQAVQFALAGKEVFDTWYEQTKAESDSAKG